MGASPSPTGNNHRVRLVEAGTIRTIAGIGDPFPDSIGDDGPATVAVVTPVDLAVGPDGSRYILESEFTGGAVRRIAPNGIISRIAGPER